MLNMVFIFGVIDSKLTLDKHFAALLNKLRNALRQTPKSRDGGGCPVIRRK